MSGITMYSFTDYIYIGKLIELKDGSCKIYREALLGLF